jgi:NAD(P)-dependent dehydrogenase (short-subunit alcohol dehydrogenase family)
VAAGHRRGRLRARRAAVDMARNGGGAIVNVSSAAATIGGPGEYVHYAGAKAALDAEIRRLTADVRGADPATPVTTCGRWTLRDLIHHAGPIHRWTAGTVAVCPGRAAQAHGHRPGSGCCP